MEAPEAPWPGTCGDPDSPTFGRAENTFTSGFEGAWTEEPTVRRVLGLSCMISGGVTSSRRRMFPLPVHTRRRGDSLHALLFGRD